MTNIQDSSKEKIKTSLLEATRAGCLDTVKEILALTSANKPSANHVGVALSSAAEAGQWDMVQLFLAMTADNKPSANHVGVALSRAAEAGQLNIVQHILAMTADNKQRADDVAEVLSHAGKLYTQRKLLVDLYRYKCRIESYRTQSGEIQYNHGFWFISNNRAVNREANYKTVVAMIPQLIDELTEQNPSISMADIQTTRQAMLGEAQHQQLRFWRSNLSHSTELRKAFHAARLRN